ncbi:MAG: gamma carbonic anhydrase family protein [Betaproteobacteria bacterium]|jgi:carbonic anhydrase/acetyltransferase-like protein (isoleucine patch superfamily)|nr:MAG: gamma carbonic anhydrase family protein [Betaproteobacteria bacterium]
MPIYQLGDWIPQIDPSAFVHETAVLIGQVSIGPNASVWPFATIRGDNEPISVGQDSNCQEGCTLHADPGFPLNVGQRVTVGHHVMLHGCTIADDCLIGIQAVILNGAVIGRGCLVGAASLITEGKQIAEGSLVLGSPGKVVRQLDAREIERSRAIAQSYVARGGRYKMALKRIG